MGNSCVSNKTDKLIQSYRSQIVSYILGTQATIQVKKIFNDTKQQIAAQFNKMPFTPAQQQVFNRIIQKVQNDQLNELQKFTAMTTEIMALKQAIDLSENQKQIILDMAKKRFQGEIKEKLNIILNQTKNVSNSKKYMNF